MKQANRYTCDMLDLDLAESSGDVLWRAGRPAGVSTRDGQAVIAIPFQPQVPGLVMQPDGSRPARAYDMVVRAYGDAVVRVTIAFDGALPGDDSVMLEWHDSLRPEPLDARATATGWDIVDTRGVVRMRLDTHEPPIRFWSDLIPPPPDTFDATVYPGGGAGIPFMACDQFFPAQADSLPLAMVERAGRPHRVAFSLHARHDEKYAGTGERFAGMNLAGRTLVLENTDALGVNNRRCYKNVPFFVSSRPYGLLMLTTAHLRLSLADISTRAAQGLIEDGVLDLFFIGGPSLERVVYNYRRVAGFPRNVPMWSFGAWMSRMSYWTAAQTREVARRLRDGGFPADVIHLDTGWFEQDWLCDWQFSRQKYPDPAAYLADMRRDGFRISLWQRPAVGPNNRLFADAMARGYLAGRGDGQAASVEGSNMAAEELAPIDFTNPDAVAWYQGMLKNLFDLGASAIKTDFGEDIDLQATYHGLPARLLHNVYALLYQKAAFDITQRSTGEGIIWARAAWVGSQRYPVHWGGDTGCTWDGMAGAIRGGLHLGLTGFAFWSHDVPGFHGVPNFMNSWPAPDLYVRWTQLGVFTSHFRYHGAQPREPYEYPDIAGTVRRWWRLRYALIPYLVAQSRKAVASGLPIFRALVFHHEDDPQCWTIDDQFYCGDDFLVAPVMNAEGVRDVYLPAGWWVDLWTGGVFKGPQWLKAVHSPLERMPVFVRRGAVAPVYPDQVQCTDQIDLARAQPLVFDETYTGLSRSILSW